MLYNRYYKLENLLDNVISEVDIVFMGNSRETRSMKVLELLKSKFSGAVYSINYDIESEKYTIIQSNHEINFRKENLLEHGKDLMQSFKDDLEKIDIEGKSILIDITSLKHPILFYFMYLIRNSFKLKHLFVTYTEPEEYEQLKPENVTKKFDLTEKFCSVKPIPGFLRIDEYNKEKILVSLMGFEGNRFGKALEDVNPGTRKTYAVVGFPSFQPGWQYYVYSENQYALEQSKAYSSLIRVTANEPFGIYNKLSEIRKTHPNSEITVAPIGTKPHSLGACMFALDYDDIKIYYDFPSFGEKKRTTGIGISLLYNLTDFINA